MKNQHERAKEPFIVHCVTCEHEWVCAYLPLPVDAIVKLMKSPCPSCGGSDILMWPVPKATTAGDARAWIANGDTGMSSETIWRVLTGWVGTAHWRASVPHDPADFGRCYRLLQAMPTWRNRLPEVAVTYPAWRGLIEAWDELAALYEAELPSGTAPKLYARMKQLIKVAA